jgi:hypothetical protein
MNNSTPIKGIERAIRLIRGHKVMLDADLASCMASAQRRAIERGG